MQGIIIPLLQATVIYALLTRAFPQLHGSWHLHAWQAFALNFVVVDYLYYWNHRLLHGPRLWRWHAVHHTVENLDVFGTSRNTLWTPFLLVYIWLNAGAVFLLANPAAYLWGAAITATLDLWRHSDLFPQSSRRLHHAIASILITPLEHAWHHSFERTNCNYGANLSWWDRLHGTYKLWAERPSKIGIPLDWPFIRKFLFPVIGRPNDAS
jgi:sterol desaturase/sphingolipid hydroxylase (fatty acid hydroxylase superfamily)